MRILILPWVPVVVALLAACNGPPTTDDACVAASGVCVASARQCAETFPYPCASGICCRAIATPPPDAGPPDPPGDAGHD